MVSGNSFRFATKEEAEASVRALTKQWLAVRETRVVESDEPTMNQAGVKTDFIRLEDQGIRGNGHMVMIEKNSLEIAKLLDEWIQKNVK